MAQEQNINEPAPTNQMDFLPSIALVFMPLLVFPFLLPKNQDLPLINATLGSPPTEVKLEVADNLVSKARGLQNRPDLPSDHGMLFVFNRTHKPRMWMKKVNFPLDVLFLDADRRIVDAMADLPPCERIGCPVYQSRAPARYAIEVPAGTIENLDLKIGDSVDFRL